MATRLYFCSSGTVLRDDLPNTFQWTGGGNYNSITNYPLAIDTPTSTAMTTISKGWAQASGTFNGIARFICPRGLAAQTISAQTIKFRMRALSTVTPIALTLLINVVDPDGLDERYAIASTYGSSISTSTLTNRGGGITSSAVTARDGDILIIEVGFEKGTASSESVSIRIGDNGGSDLPENETSTSDFNGWVEFANTLTFLTTEQEGFRFRNDDGSESAATWKAAQDVGIATNASTTARLRMLTNTNHSDPATATLTLQYRLRTDPEEAWDTVTT